MEKYTTIPTNRAKDGKVIYTEQSLIDKLVPLEQCKILEAMGLDIKADYYWYNNSVWNKNEPIGIMTSEDAQENTGKGSFLDFDDTVPAYYIEDYKQFSDEVISILDSTGEKIKSK